MTQNEHRHKYDNTHLWYRGELPICVKCGATPISLGQWGDDTWKRTHNDWKKPCPVDVEWMAGACRPKISNFKHPDLFAQLSMSDIWDYLKRKHFSNGENNDSK